MSEKTPTKEETAAKKADDDAAKQAEKDKAAVAKAVKPPMNVQVMQGGVGNFRYGNIVPAELMDEDGHLEQRIKLGQLAWTADPVNVPENMLTSATKPRPDIELQVVTEDLRREKAELQMRLDQKGKEVAAHKNDAETAIGDSKSKDAEIEDLKQKVKQLTDQKAAAEKAAAEEAEKKSAEKPKK